MGWMLAVNRTTTMPRIRKNKKWSKQIEKRIWGATDKRDIMASDKS